MRHKNRNKKKERLPKRIYNYRSKKSKQNRGKKKRASVLVHVLRSLSACARVARIIHAPSLLPWPSLNLCFPFFFPSLDKHVLSAGTCSCIERATKSAQKGKKAGMEESREWLSVSRRIVYKNEEFCSFDIISKPVLGERRWCAVVQVEEYFLVNFCYCEKVAVVNISRCVFKTKSKDYISWTTAHLFSMR